jgi:hypothetical protein
MTILYCVKRERRKVGVVSFSLEHHKSVRAKSKERKNTSKGKRTKPKSKQFYKTKMVICMICNKKMRQENKKVKGD